jgi:hypothetical protein
VKCTKNRSYAVLVIIIVASASVVDGVFYYIKGTKPQPCDNTKPLRLTQVQEGEFFGSSQPELDLVWQNCAGHAIQFTVQSSALKVVISTFGAQSTVEATLDTTGTFSIMTVSGTVLPIYFSSPVSPNAVILHVTGTARAKDPTTGQDVSTESSFAT